MKTDESLIIRLARLISTQMEELHLNQDVNPKIRLEWIVHMPELQYVNMKAAFHLLTFQSDIFYLFL
jgi:hypothetical protein